MNPRILFMFLILGLCSASAFSLPNFDARIDKYLEKTRSKRTLDRDLLKHVKQHIYKSIDQIFHYVRECKARGITALECEMTAIAKVGADREGGNRNQEKYGVEKATNGSSQQQIFDSISKNQNQRTRNHNLPSNPVQNKGETRVEYAERPDPRLDERQGGSWVLQPYSNSLPPSFEKPQIAEDPSGSSQENQGELVNSAKDLTRPWFPQRPSERPPIPRNSNSSNQSNVQQSVDDNQRPSFAVDPSDTFMRRDRGTAQRLTQQIFPSYKNKQPSPNPDKPLLTSNLAEVSNRQNPNRPREVSYLTSPQSRDGPHLNYQSRPQINTDATEPIIGRNGNSGYQSYSSVDHQSLTKPWFPQPGYGQPRVASGRTESPKHPIHKIPLPLPIQNLEFSSPGVQQRYDHNRYHSLFGSKFRERIAGSPKGEQPIPQRGTEVRVESVGSYHALPLEGSNVLPRQERLSRRPGVEPRFESVHVSPTTYEDNKYQRPVKLPKFDPIFNDQDGVRNAMLLRGAPYANRPSQNLVDGTNRQENYQVRQASSPTPRISVLPTGQPSARPYVNPKVNISRSSDGVLNIQIEGKTYQIVPSDMFKARTGGYSDAVDDEDLRVAVPDISAKVSTRSNKQFRQNRSTGSELNTYASDDKFNTDSTEMIGARAGGRVESSQEGINVESDLDPDHTNFENAEEAGSEVDSLRAHAVRNADNNDQLL
nr:hypothetical protein HmN_000363400 [Hymenolepis microstoma]